MWFKHEFGCQNDIHSGHALGSSQRAEANRNHSKSIRVNSLRLISSIAARWLHLNERDLGVACQTG